jgi:biopolymer transport protein ExbB
MHNYLSLVVRAIACTVLLAVATPAWSWYVPGSGTIRAMKHRMKLVIDPAQVIGASDLDDFSILVDITDPTLKGLQADGGDIVFTSATDSLLYHDIDTVDTSTGRVIAWVRRYVSTSADTPIYMYYGNADMDNGFSANITWDTPYAGVWHFTGSDTTPDDSSGNSRSLSANGDPTENVTGKIGAGISVTRNSSWLIIPWGVTNGTTNIDTTSITMCCWFNLSTDTAGDAHVFAHGNTGATPNVSENRYYLRARQGTTNDPFSSRVANGDSGGVSTSTTGTWYRGCISSDSAANTYIARVNTTSIANGIAFGSTPLAVAGDFLLGTAYNVPAEGMTGTIDEAYIYTGTRTADWLDTEYNNQNAPTQGNFYKLVGKKEQRVRVN